MQEYTLFHPEHGQFITSNNTMVDRKLAMGYKFMDELTDDETKLTSAKKTKKQHKSVDDSTKSE